MLPSLAPLGTLVLGDGTAFAPDSGEAGIPDQLLEADAGFYSALGTRGRFGSQMVVLALDVFRGG